MSLQGKTNEEKIWNYLSKKGISDFGVAGLMGNIYAESGLSPTNLQNTFEKKLGYSDTAYTNAVDNGTYKNFAKDSAGYGLCQWTYHTRKQALLDYAKSKSKSIGDLEMQLNFLYKELSESYSSLLSSLKLATSVLNASNDVLTKFERPADQSFSVQTKRASYGQKYYDIYHKDSGSNSKGENNMANTVDKVIAIAKAEVGYLEKKSNSQLDSKTANAGSANYTKYGRDMHKLYPSVMDFPAYWCDAFVDWCFYKAYGVTNAKKLLGGNFDDYTVASCQLYKNKNALDTTPSVGAQVFFTKNGQVSGCHHTGIVYKVDKTYFYTIEGNTSGASGVVSNGGGVAYKKYSIMAYKGKVLFGHPKYDKKVSNKSNDKKNDSSKKTNSSNTSNTKKKTTKKVADAKSFSKSIAGTYKVSASDGLNLRYEPGKLTDDNKVITISNGKKVQCYGYYTTVDGIKWYLVTYGEKTGFVSSKYLKKC